MPRLFDQIVKVLPKWRDCQWVNCDAVVDIATEWVTTNYYGDIPRITPPWSKVFLEIRAPLRIQKEVGIQYIGAHISTHQTSLVKSAFTEQFRDALPEIQDIAKTIETTSKHILIIDFVACQDMVLGIVPPKWVMGLSDIGQRVGLIATMDRSELGGASSYEDLSQRSESYLAVFCFFLGLLNAKNVELIDNPPPKKANQRHIEKHGVPMLSYKVLKVAPATLKHYTQDIEEQAKSGEKREIPLHLVRGHFKDYRDGKGLFGRVKDVIWFQEQWRGKPENGIALKDYELHPPKAEHQE